MDDRIVITGVGAISPIGLTAEECWQNAINGFSGVGPLTLFDTSNYQIHIAAEVKGFSPEKYIELKDVRRRDRYQQLALAAVQEAVEQSGLNDLPSQKINPERIGVVVSSAIGGLTILHEAIGNVLNNEPRRLGPFVIPMLMSNGASGLIAIEYGFQGPCMSVASACASGSDGIGIAWLLIRSGMADIVVTGGSEATITPVAVGAFDRLGAMSRKNELTGNRYLTPQPFDRDRDGLVIGEGASILVIEKESHARKRGVRILAELAGYASTADAFHITAPSEDGSGGARAISLALESASANLDEVSYINAHGTATSLNDYSETLAIKKAFGKQAYNIPVSSTKSMTGHMMGATGALEVLFCMNTIRDGIIPPTINYVTPDPQCDLDFVPNQAREKEVKTAISNAFGFGGHNSVLVLRKYV